MRRGKTFFRWLSGWLLLSMLGVGVRGGAGLSVRAAPRQQTAGSIVISEFRTNGPAGATDEFIELFNQTNSTICIENWQLKVLTGTGNEAVRATIPSNVAIGPGSYYLIANNNYGGTSDLTYGTGIVDSGGIAIFDENNVKIDSVGTSSSSIYAEGNFLNPLTGNMDRSYERTFNITTGIYDDTDDNLNDFQEISPSTPEYSGGFTATCSYAPLSVIISEVAWMGTLASSDDEWIELYNPGSSSIDLTNWRLVADNGSPDIVLSGTISPKRFFLLERAYDNVITGVAADQIYVGELEDTNEVLRLRAPDGTLVDTANSDGGEWPAGAISPNGSMERMGTLGDAPLAWVTNVNAGSWSDTDASGLLVHGTPRRANWGFGVTHTPIPTSTFTPSPSPTPPPTAPLTIVISEVAWAGTLSSSDDEWIELYNPTTRNINLTGWNLRSLDGSPNIQDEFDGIILNAGEYLLLERTDDDPTDVDADVIYSGSLSNNGEVLRLYDPNGYLVDSANSNSGTWPAGNAATYSSMQRSLIATDSNFVWVTYDSARDNDPNITKAKDASGNLINGTPGRGNTPFNVTTTPTPQSNTGSGSGSGGSGTITLPPILGISEFLPRPGYDWNNDGVVDVFDEFIEIINAGQIDVNLSAYRLDDEQNLGSPPYTLPNLTLQPGERAVFYAAETGILLSDAGDTVRLLRGSTVVDAYTYGVVGYPDHAWCRIPDRLGYWNDPCFPTPGNPNALTGTIPLPPDSVTGYRPPVCLLPDTTPDVFVYAECEVGGDGIWNRQFWDKADDTQRLKLEESPKGEAIFE